jgi:hypothetical protein
MLQLRSKLIVSNVLQGGKTVPLSGARIISPVDREVLMAHGINPDDPTIPINLIKTASRIGILARGDYPFVGVDFILDKSGRYIYLETNFEPSISPELIGLPLNTDTSTAHLALMKKIISSAK